MTLLQALLKAAKDLENPDTVTVRPNFECVIVAGNGLRTELSRELCQTIFGSVENFEKVKDCFTESDSLEYTGVSMEDDVLFLVEAHLASVEEV